MFLGIKYSTAQLTQTMTSNPGHERWQCCYLKWKKRKAQRKVFVTACLKNASAWERECCQETQKNEAGRMCVFCYGFRNLTHGSLTLEVAWPLLMKFLFSVSFRAVLEKQGGGQQHKWKELWNRKVKKAWGICCVKPQWWFPSRRMIAEDAEGGLFTVTLFRKVMDDFKAKARENR